MINILVLYRSPYGQVERMAQAEEEGAREVAVARQQSSACPN
jgi:multimeric flavodoxin WrbA